MSYLCLVFLCLYFVYVYFINNTLFSVYFIYDFILFNLYRHLSVRVCGTVGRFPHWPTSTDKNRPTVYRSSAPPFIMIMLAPPLLWWLTSNSTLPCSALAGAWAQFSAQELSPRKIFGPLSSRDLGLVFAVV